MKSVGRAASIIILSILRLFSAGGFGQELGDHATIGFDHSRTGLNAHM